MSPGNIDPRRATSGHLIGDAEAGDRRVTLKDCQALDTFKVGGWALLHWFSRQRLSFPSSEPWLLRIRESRLAGHADWRNRP